MNMQSCSKCLLPCGRLHKSFFLSNYQTSQLLPFVRVQEAGKTLFSRSRHFKTDLLGDKWHTGKSLKKSPYVGNMAADRAHDMVDEYTCFVSQNDPFQLGYIRINLDKGTGAVFNTTG